MAITFDEKGSEFGKVLKSRVAAYFAETGLSQRADAMMWFKVVLFIGGTIGLYFYLLFGSHTPLQIVLTCIAIGLGVSGVGFNVMHDAVHGNFGTKPWVSQVLSYAMDLFGVSGYFYRIKHTIVHHTWTNIPGEDADIAESPIIRASPHMPLWKIHRYQHIYTPFLYSFLAIAWILHADYDKMAKLQYCSFKFKRPSVGEQVLFYMFKAFNLTYSLVIPLMMFPVANVLACYFLIHMTAGLMLAYVFQLAHINEYSMYPKPEEGTSRIQGGWARHQVLTTTNFATRNPFVCFYLGGLNFQIEHHLFPRVSHSHYPAINRIVMKTCSEFRVPYQEFSTFTGAMVSHMKQLYLLGHACSKYEATDGVDRATAYPKEERATGTYADSPGLGEPAAITA